MKVVRLTSVRTKAVDVLGLQWVDREKASAFGLGALPSDKNTVRLYNYNIELSHWYKVDKVFYTLEAKLRCVKVTSYITKRS